MATTKDLMLSVAQVCDLQPGDENNATWINPGLSGVVRAINRKQTKAGKPFWPCVIADVNGPETIEVSFFTAPKFAEGDLIDIFGKGLRRTAFNGKPQAAIGRDTQIEVIGRSAHHEQQSQAATAGEPAMNGKPQLVNGQTVGMAVKEALNLVITSYRNTSTEAPDTNTAEFWKAVKQTASNIIRVSQSLEKGHLSPASWPTGHDRPPPPQSGGRSDPPKAASRPAPGPGGSVGCTDDDGDVPF